ncbi:MAG: ABC transporter permease, partial [Eggerthellaceae bacterium]|nr:ABC transporter permease [Eggerthellaceae bacterium]
MSNTKKKTGVGDLLMKLGPLMVLALLFVIFAIALPGKFMRVSNLMNVQKQTSLNCLIAAGMLLALITAGIDLSVGYNTILATCLIGVMMQNGITNPVILIVAAILLCTFCGFVNGSLYTRLDLPHPYVSTLGMKFVLWGM